MRARAAATASNGECSPQLGNVPGHACFCLGECRGTTHRELWPDFSRPLTLGVVLGLLIGKPIGITLASWLAVRSGIASLPTGVSWRQDSRGWLAWRHRLYDVPFRGRTGICRRAIADYGKTRHLYGVVLCGYSRFGNPDSQVGGSQLDLSIYTDHSTGGRPQRPCTSNHPTCRCA